MRCDSPESLKTASAETNMRHFFGLLMLLAMLGACLASQFEFDLNDLPQFGSFDDALDDSYSLTSNRSLLWGPYRSALYFGVRPRIPRSLLSGLMWFNIDGYNGVGNIRHFYEQSDNMGRANWIKYDPRYGGTQIIEDNDCHITIYIDFVKSKDGLSWAVKVKSVPHSGHENVKTSFVWYSGLEGEADTTDPLAGGRTGVIQLDNTKNKKGYEGTVTLSGGSEELGLFELSINDGPSSNRHPRASKLIKKELNPKRTHHLSLVVPDDNVWVARDIFITLLQESVKDLIEGFGTLEGIPPEQAYVMRDMHNFEGNLHLVQKIYQGPSEFEVVFNNAVTPEEDKITFDNINSRITEMKNKVDSKFEKHYKLQPPFNKGSGYKEFAQEIVSGLLGGLTYMYGDHLVDRDTVFEDDSFEKLKLQGSPEGPHELFTLVPSRPFFPRGFLWDEGFHVLPLLEYDSDLVFEILQSWFKLIDDEGWIAREQILGPEARSRVPEEFQVQSPQIVNPPTLMLAFTYLLSNFDASGMADMNKPYNLDEPSTSEPGQLVINNPELLLNYAKEIYPRLKTHFHWFRRTQRGYIEEFDRGTNLEGFRWRGRTLTHNLASGLDDYPRALPADVAELNVDLLAWIGVMAKSMIQMATILELKDEQEEYEKIFQDITENLEKIHWSKEEKTYCDVSLDDDEENIKVCYKGYISLFPFITKMIPRKDTEKISHIVDLIKDPEELWSDYGIRSLSKSSELYRSGENYWRSPIWMNINYLVLDALKHYFYASKEYDENLSKTIAATYKQLRVNLVENVYKEWKRTGFVWEQYDDETGSAQRAKNFLGWTSTVVLMMTMEEELR